MIGEQIKKARKLKGMSQEELAYSIEVHSNTVARWERGEINPTGKSLKKIAQVLKVPISSLDDEQLEPEQELSLAYWGEVADNIRKLMKSNDERKIAIIKPMLLDSLDIQNDRIFINQENIGHDAIANVNQKVNEKL